MRVIISSDDIAATIVAEQELEKVRRKDERQPLYVPVPEHRPEPTTSRDEPVQTVIVIEF